MKTIVQCMLFAVTAFSTVSLAQADEPSRTVVVPRGEEVEVRVRPGYKVKWDPKIIGRMDTIPAGKVKVIEGGGGTTVLPFSLALGPMVFAGLTYPGNLRGDVGGGATLEFSGEHAFVGGEAGVGYCGNLSLHGAVNAGYSFTSGFRLGAEFNVGHCMDTRTRIEESVIDRVLGLGMLVGYRAPSFPLELHATVGGAVETFSIPTGRDTKVVPLLGVTAAFPFEIISGAGSHRGK